MLLHPCSKLTEISLNCSMLEQSSRAFFWIDKENSRSRLRSNGPIFTKKNHWNAVLHRFSFCSSVNNHHLDKLFWRRVEPAENPEQDRVVLPSARFQKPRKSRGHKLQEGERVVLLSLTAGGWIDSGFRGTIRSITSSSDALGRACPRATVEWDEGRLHPSRTSTHALSRLRPVQ